MRDGASISSAKALELNVIDVVAGDIGELLSAIDGRPVKLADGERVLATEGLVDSLGRAGLYEQAAGWGLHFYNTWKLEGLNLQQPLGYLSLLSVARTDYTKGGIEQLQAYERLLLDALRGVAVIGIIPMISLICKRAMP